MTELPPNNTRRWVARRKAAVVAAVSSGTLTIEEVCRRYRMSEEELFAWQRAFETHGIVGLRAGYAQEHRSAHPRTDKKMRRRREQLHGRDGGRGAEQSNDP
jgi:transposase-like protein